MLFNIKDWKILDFKEMENNSYKKYTIIDKEEFKKLINKELGKSENGYKKQDIFDQTYGEIKNNSDQHLKRILNLLEYEFKEDNKFEYVIVGYEIEETRISLQRFSFPKNKIVVQLPSNIYKEIISLKKDAKFFFNKEKIKLLKQKKNSLLKEVEDIEKDILKLEKLNSKKV